MKSEIEHAVWPPPKTTTAFVVCCGPKNNLQQYTRKSHHRSAQSYNNRSPKMHLMYYLDESGKRVYTLKVRIPDDVW